MRGADGNDEFDRRFARALMQPLEKRVLAVGARSRPTARARSDRRARRRRARRACRCFRGRAAAGRREVAPAPAHRARRRARGARAGRRSTTRQDRAAPAGCARAAPCESARSTLAPPGEKVGEAIPAERQHDRQSRPPTTANSGRRPSPTAAARLPWRCRMRSPPRRWRSRATKCAPTSTPRPSARGEPRLRARRVGERLAGGEGLRRDDEQRRRRIERRQRAREMLGIDVGNESDVDASVCGPLLPRVAVATERRRTRAAGPDRSHRCRC